MSEYDGEIQLSVSLKPGDIKTSAQRLAQSVKSIFDANAGKTLDKSLQKIAVSMDKVNNRASVVQAKMRELEKTKVETKEYSSLGKELDVVSTKMSHLRDAMRELESVNNTASPKYAQLRTEMRKLEQVEDQLLEKSWALEKSGKAYIQGANTEQYKKLSNELSQLNNQQRINIASYEQTESKLNDVGKSADKTANKIKKVSGEAKKSTKSFANLGLSIGSTLKRLLLLGLGVSTIYTLINKMRTAIVSGLTEMAKMNNGNNQMNKSLSMLSSSFATLKNSIAAAVAPLVNLLAPALARIVDLCAQAANAIASFIAALTGKSSFMKATKVQQNFAGSLDKTAGSAKKAKKELQQLAGFDELNVLHKDDDDSSGGGGGGGGAKPAFEEVKIDPKILDWVNKLKDAWAKIADYLKQLKDAFMSGFWEAMGDWQSKVDDIKKNLGIIWEDLKEIATDPNVLAAADRWAKSFAHMLGTTVGMFASIGLTIAQNLIGGFAKFLEENKNQIKQWLVEMFDVGTAINDQIAEFEVALARIFDVFGQQFGQELTANIMGIFWELYSNITLLAAKLGRDIITLITQPIIDNTAGFQAAFNGLLQVLSMFAQTIKDTLDSIFADVQGLYDQHIKPFFDALTVAISGLVEDVLRAFNNYIQPVLLDLMKRLDELMSAHVAPVFSQAMQLIGALIDIVTKLLGPAIKGVGTAVKATIALITPLIKMVGTVVVSVIGTIMDILAAGLKYWTDVFKGMAQILEDVINIIKALISGDFSTAMDLAKQLVSDAVTMIETLFLDMLGVIETAFKGTVNQLISGAEALINAAVGIINNFTDLVTDIFGGMSFDIPDWVPVYGGKHFEIDVAVPHISEVSFPRLAQGAVIPPNKEFMAVLGDQTSGTNIETPLSTMIEAFNAAKGDEEALLREQNEILRQLLYKEWKLDPKDVFNATREQNQDFIRRTGKSAFAY